MKYKQKKETNYFFLDFLENVGKNGKGKEKRKKKFKLKIFLIEKF